MKILTLNCNACGAPLEVSAKAKYVTCRYCEAQLVVKHEESAAWTEAVEEIASNVAVLELDVELMKLDREWEQEREGLLVLDSYGHLREPHPLSWFLPIPVFVLGGIYLLINSSFRSFGGGVVPVLGVSVPIAFVAFLGWRELRKKRALESAQRRYEERRRELILEAKSASAEGMP